MLNGVPVDTFGVPLSNARALPQDSRSAAASSAGSDSPTHVQAPVRCGRYADCIHVVQLRSDA